MMARYGLGLTIWGPLASGFLSGKYTRENLSAPGNRYSLADYIHFDKEAGFALVEKLRAIANAQGASVAQVALAWPLSKPAVTSVILGASKASQLADNLGAVNLTLDPETIAQLDAATAPSVLYPQWHLDDFRDMSVLDALS